MNTSSYQKFNFSRLDDAAFFGKVKCILQCMCGRPDYPEPVPSTAMIIEAFKQYHFALYHENKVEYGEFLKLEKRKNLEMLLIKLPAFSASAMIDICSETFEKQSEELMVA